MLSVLGGAALGSFVLSTTAGEWGGERPLPSASDFCRHDASQGSCVVAAPARSSRQARMPCTCCTPSFNWEGRNTPGRVRTKSPRRTLGSRRTRPRPRPRGRPRTTKTSWTPPTTARARSGAGRPCSSAWNAVIRSRTRIPSTEADDATGDRHNDGAGRGGVRRGLGRGDAPSEDGWGKCERREGCRIERFCGGSRVAREGWQEVGDLERRGHARC